MKAAYRLSGIPKECFPTDFARMIPISRMILSMIKVRTVSPGRMASGFGGKAKTDSDERMKTDILMLAIVCKGVAVPLLWKFLTKRMIRTSEKKGIPILTNGKS